MVRNRRPMLSEGRLCVTAYPRLAAGFLPKVWGVAPLLRAFAGAPWHGAAGHIADFRGGHSAVGGDDALKIVNDDGSRFERVARRPEVGAGGAGTGCRGGAASRLRRA